MILVWLIELLFIILIMKFIESIGFINTCLIYGFISAIGALFSGLGLGGILAGFVSGLISGAIAFIAAKFFLFLIDVLGSIAYFLIILFFVLVIVAIIL